jgi:hypothetical protein
MASQREGYDWLLVGVKTRESALSAKVRNVCEDSQRFPLERRELIYPGQILSEIYQQGRALTRLDNCHAIATAYVIPPPCRLVAAQPERKTLQPNHSAATIESGPLRQDGWKGSQLWGPWSHSDIFRNLYDPFVGKSRPLPTI